MRIVFVTAPPEEAPVLLRKLVEERLVAGGNIIPGVRSIYHWQDEICDEPEAVLLMETADARVEEMMARIRGYLHEEIESRGFERIRSLIEVRLRDGRVLTKEAHTSRGTPERPMTGDELADKFRECSQDIIPPRNVDSLLDMAWQLEDVSDIKAFTGLLQGNPG